MMRFHGLGLGAAVLGSLVVPVQAQDAGAPSAQGVIELPTIEIVQTTPLLGSGIDAAKVPANISVVTQSDIARRNSPNIEDAIQQNVPGVILSNQAGSPFQPDLEYRGFVASPVSGTPQGLAVYQNGVRINESFGDIVNWDFIPPMAIRDIDVLPNNPAFGLNALGGAVSVTMKNGFTNPGGTFDIHGGSFGRVDSSLEYGKQAGAWASYFAIEGLHEDGWRDFSASRLLRGYGDLGYKGDEAEVHLSFTGADNKLGADGTTPIGLLGQRFAAVYTTPQTSTNQLAFVNLQGTYTPSATLSVQSNVYFRHYNQVHVDGNTTDVQACDPGSFPGFLCFGNGSTPALGPNGKQLADLSNGAQLGETDDTRVNTNSIGGTLQATSTEKLDDHGNQFVIGTSVDHGWTAFRGSSELGIIQPDLVLTNLGQFIDQPDGGVAPVGVSAQNTYVGVYGLDTFDVTPRFSITAGGRFNFAEIDLKDELGGNANGNNQFTRFNPVIGGTYKLTPEITAYAGYSEANRAPTPLELGCADPVHPCILQNFLISDPPLKQVVSRTVEGGFRGEHDLPAEWGHLNWSVGAFRTENTNDILNVPSTISGFGYFQNVGTTLRQGLEADVHYRIDRLTASLGYSFVDATFQTPLTLSSPDNPRADAEGNISVKKGDHIPAVPQHRVKFGIDYCITDKWTVGADLLLASGQYIVGDAANQLPKIRGYNTVNLQTAYQVTDHIQVYGMIENLFDHHSFTYGTFYEKDDIAFLNFKNPVSLNPATPFAAYGGLRATF